LSNFTQAVTAAIAVAVTSGGTGCGDREKPAADLGRALFADKRLSTSPFNDFSCSTCHQVEEAKGGPTRTAERIDSGYDLANTVHRKGWWGGYETTLLGAINVCLKNFMGAEPLGPESPEARQLYEYLFEASPDTAAPPLPLTVVKTVSGLPDLAGSASSGEKLYRAACRHCHGDPHTGEGKKSRLASRLPEDTLAVFPTQGRAVVEEKIRHGRFFDIGGVMPLYPSEVLGDQDVADILTYLGL
jgi:thiosulfate dehydrogenase